MFLTLLVWHTRLMSHSVADLGIDPNHLHRVERTSGTFVVRVFSRVLATPGCWWWTGTLTPDGYGVLGRGRRGAGNIFAHRAVWELLVGPVPDGLVYDHLCRNRQCVSPEHAEMVTLEENKRRGFGPAVLHSIRPTCSRGHPKDGTTQRSDGSPRHRYCKTCARTKSHDRHHARKAGVSA